jgi:hypothetical protein
MYNMPRLFSLVTLLLCAPIISSGQFFDYGFTIGATNYKGDLSPNIDLQNTFLGAGFVYRYHLSNSVNLRGTAVLAGIRGADENVGEGFYNRRGLSFRSYFLEPAVGIEYLFLDFRFDKKRDRFTPYVFLSAGATIAYTTLEGPDGNEIGGGGIQVLPSLPFGLGFKKMISERWDMNIEFSSTKVFSDKVDGFETYGADRFKVNNSETKDMYYYISIGFSYNFYFIRCPKPALRSI